MEEASFQDNDEKGVSYHSQKNCSPSKIVCVDSGYVFLYLNRTKSMRKLPHQVTKKKLESLLKIPV